MKQKRTRNNSRGKKNKAPNPGGRLRAEREWLGLTLREVEAKSRVIAAEQRDHRFVIPTSRLFMIERKKIVPSIFRLYALALIYRQRMGELLR